LSAKGIPVPLDSLLLLERAPGVSGCAAAISMFALAVGVLVAVAIVMAKA